MVYENFDQLIFTLKNGSKDICFTVGKVPKQSHDQAGEHLECAGTEWSWNCITNS